MSGMHSKASDYSEIMKQNIHPGLVLFFLLSVWSSVFAQEKKSIQVKAFDQQLNAYPNIELAINGKDYIRLGARGVTFAEVLESDLPPASITLKDAELEAESWNYSRGILEVIVRKKNFRLYKFFVRFKDNTPLQHTEVIHLGKNTSNFVTDHQGKFELVLGLSESTPARDQFHIRNFIISRFHISEKENSIVVEPVKSAPLAKTDKVEMKSGEEKYFKDFDLNHLDSIQSLTVFYAVFKNFQMSDLSGPMKEKMDQKFKDLMSQLEDSVKSATPFIGKISDSTFVNHDIKNLLLQAEAEHQVLDDLRHGFDEKIQIINDKLSGGLSSLDPEIRDQVWQDIVRLEKILKENELKFYRNQSDYHSILFAMKEKFFDVKDLENKLYISEVQRVQEKESFQRKIITIFLVSMGFAALAIMLLYFSKKLKMQQIELVKANNEVKRINENLEGLVYQRTALLENAHREMDTFLYKASHDLQGPICSIIGLCNIATRMVNPESLEIVERTYNTAISMDRMLKKLKVISEINQPGDGSVVLLHQELMDLKDRFRQSIRETSVNFTIECSPTVSIRSYVDVIQIILENLVENAITFASMKNGSIPEVTLKAVQQHKSVQISIFDNGVGISPEITDRVWDMFYIGNEESPGNGLGLYIVRKCVQALNGYISLESEVNKFTRIVVVIPTLEPVRNDFNPVSETFHLSA